MAGQGPSRRELLQALALASAASAFPGFSRWSYALASEAGQRSAAAMPQPSVNPVYSPRFFSPSQYRSVEVLADLILPATHSDSPVAGQTSAGRLQPGAREAGVAEFIDFMVFSDPTLQPQFREGLNWLDRASSPPHRFPDLTSAQQNAILERLAYKAKHREGEEAGQQFFELFRRYTVMGFYTTRVGLESLDYPGLTFYDSSPGCTHPGNPEHIGL